MVWCHLVCGARRVVWWCAVWCHVVVCGVCGVVMRRDVVVCGVCVVW